MGIPGLFKEIGPGQRISLAKIAVQHLEHTGRPFRLAIDYAIWSFQNQAGQGGRNPALRTLYYRCLKLLSLAIQPVFVFDGSRKPSLKRNVIVHTNENHWIVQRTKELLDAFGFTYHQAPGEAEAECALLQASGLVDAVLSEDIDTLMFGCGYTLRSWSAEQSRTNKTPTHVSVYTADDLRSKAGLDRQGMILVALMSGGDYDTGGVPGCGLRVACEAARAGFGKSLCDLDDDDNEGMKLWKQNLQTELSTNLSKHFRQKHRNLALPDAFPNKTILGYYRHPVTSDEHELASVRTTIHRVSNTNVSLLRAFVATHFGWSTLRGAQRMIRGLAPALLVQKLVLKADREVEQSIESQETAELQLIKCISNRRLHWDTDESQELRITYIPAEIVGFDLSQEDDDVDCRDDSAGDQALDNLTSPSKAKTWYDPTKLEKIWVLETFVKLGAPLLAEGWEEDLQNLKKLATERARQKKATAKLHPQHGDMDRYVKIRKGLDTDLLDRNGVEKTLVGSLSDTRPYQVTDSKDEVERRLGETEEPLSVTKNPWTLSRRPSDTYSFRPLTRYSALGIYPIGEPETSEAQVAHQSPEKEDQFQREHETVSPLSRNLSNVTMRTPRRTRSSWKTQHSVRSPKRCGRLGDEGGSFSVLGSRTALAGSDRDVHSPATSNRKNRQPSNVEGTARPVMDRYSAGRFIQDSESTTCMRRLVALRQSLEGAWKYLEPEERHLAKAVFEKVEFLDLTALPLHTVDK